MMERLKKINKCKKNICDIDKLLDIYNKNIDIKDKQIIKQLKSRKNKYIIELYYLTDNNYTLDNVNKISEMRIDYSNHIKDMKYDFENRYVKILFEMNDGTLLEQSFPLKRLEVHNGRSDYVFE